MINLKIKPLPHYKYCPICQMWKMSRDKIGISIDFMMNNTPICKNCRREIRKLKTTYYKHGGPPYLKINANDAKVMIENFLLIKRNDQSQNQN